MRPMNRITFCLSCIYRFITYLLDLGWGPDPPSGARVPAVDVFYVAASPEMGLEATVGVMSHP
jgi:hypothetical protein